MAAIVANPLPERAFAILISIMAMAWHLGCCQRNGICATGACVGSSAKDAPSYLHPCTTD